MARSRGDDPVHLVHYESIPPLRLPHPPPLPPASSPNRTHPSLNRRRQPMRILRQEAQPGARPAARHANDEPEPERRGRENEQARWDVQCVGR